MHTILSFGTIKQVIAILIAIAIVVAAGVVVGQAPAIFGAEIDDEPEASIEFEDQHGDGTSVEIATVNLSDGGFVVVSDRSGEILGSSEALEAGDHENVTVEQDADGDLDMYGELIATVHHDSTGDGEFVYEETDGEEDRPYLEDGYPVRDSATVTMAERPEDAPRDSFVVESVGGPSTATTTQTVEFVGEVRNPAEFEQRGYAELRIDGELIERQVATFASDETRELVFEVELRDVGPGNHTYGVYTAVDGAHGEVEIEFDGPPSVTVAEQDESSVTVEAGLPDGGFVAVENEDGDAIGTSDALDAGLHETVTIEFDEGVDANETLTVVAYEGSPDDPESASAYEDEDGERVRTTVGPVAEDETAGEDDETDDGDD